VAVRYPQFHSLTSRTAKTYGSRIREERDLAQGGILRFENVAKSFGGTQALKGVSFDVNRGEVVALLGENGAGKSTLIKVLGGIVDADSGAVSIDGEPYRHRADARQSVAFVHQDLGLIEWMTVAENMALARGYPRRGSRMLFAPIDWASAERRA
jgi:ribose transport system ATP-binding protein